MNHLPQAFLDDMARELGSEFPAFLRAYEEPYRRGLRLNPLKPLSEEALRHTEGLGDAIPWAAEGRFLRLDSRAGAHPLHEAGGYYLQEPSAMLPAAVLNPQPGERVLDLCAAPGGKTTQMAGHMAGEGILVCNEPVPKRAQVLGRNVERMGVSNALVTCELPPKLAAKWPGAFDAVLVDAPCSGEGMFRRHPETRDEWSPESREGCAKRQAEILSSAAALVRPGGRLVYATCTLNRTENEENVAAFCARNPDFHPVPFAAGGCDAPAGMLTCYPHRMPGEGQFCALLRRDGDEEAALFPDASLPRPDKQLLAALRGFDPEAPAPTAMLGDTAVFFPGCPDVRGIRVLRAGLHLGGMKGKVFQPEHAWAVSGSAPAAPRVALGEMDAARYLAGETIALSDHVKGWVIPTLWGLALGWGKISDGIMKNHYPKGLRRDVG